MAEVTAAIRDEGLANLEAFLDLLRSTRGALASAEEVLEARAETLAEEAALVGTRVEAFGDAVGAVAGSFVAGHHDVVADLATLGQAALAAAESHVAGVRSGLHTTHAALKAGVAKGHEEVSEGALEIHGALTRSAEEAQHLQAHVGGLHGEVEALTQHLETGLHAAAAQLGESTGAACGVLDEAAAFVSDGLFHYANAAFDSLVAHLETEAEPAVTELLDDLSASLLNILDQVDTVVEAAGDELLNAAEAVLGDACREMETAHKQRQAEESRSLGTAERTLHETQHCCETMEKGGDVVATLTPLAPQLAMARDVADRVQEMMDMMNPFE